MSDKIEYNDLFASDAFSQAVTGMDAILKSFQLLQGELKTSLTLQKEFLGGFKAQKYEDIQRLNTELNKVEQTLKDYNVTATATKQSEIELAKLRQQQAKAIQEEEKAAQQKLKTDKATQSTKQKTLTLYQQESKTLRDLKNEYKNVALAEGQMSKAAQDLLAKITPLDNKLKQLDKTTGDNFRNVGNYAGALDTFKTGITSVLGAAGIGLGVSGIVNVFKDSIKLANELEVSLKNLQAITGASNSDLEFYAENAKLLGVNIEGGSKAVVEAYKLIGSAKPELLANKNALNDVTKAAITLSQAAGLELPDAATRLTDALNQFGAPAKEAGKFIDVLAAGAQAGAAEVPQITEALLKFGVAAKSSNISIQESVGAIELLAEKGLKGAEAGTALRNVFAKLATAKILPKEALAELNKAGVDIKKLSDTTLPLNERLKELSKIQGDASAITRIFGLENKTAGEILISNIPRLNELTTAVDKNGVASEQAKTNTDTFSQSLLVAGNNIDNLKISIGESNGLLKGLVDGFNDVAAAANSASTSVGKVDKILRQRGINQSFFESLRNENAALGLAFKNQLDSVVATTEKTGDYKKGLEELKKAFIINEAALATKKISEKQYLIQLAILDATTKEFKESQKASTEVVKNDSKAIDENTKAVGKNTKTKKEAESPNDRTKINKELKKVDDEYAAKKEKDENDRLNAERDARNAAFKAEIDRLQKEQDDAKAKREQELKDLADMAQKALSIAEKQIKIKEKLRNDALDKEIADNEKNIDRQRQLADKGLANTLAFEEKKKAELERKKEDEAKKEIKREKTLAFFKLFAANAEKDPNSALQKTIVEMVIGEGIAAAFIEGTENVGQDKQFSKNKFSNKQDGYLARFDGDERIINPNDNAKIGNMSNEDLASLAYDYQNGLMPKYAIADSMAMSNSLSNIHSSAQLNQLVSLNKNIESLKDIIKNKKETHVAIDNIGNVVRTQIENGLKSVEIIKGRRL